MNIMKDFEILYNDNIITAKELKKKILKQVEDKTTKLNNRLNKLRNIQ